MRNAIRYAVMRGDQILSDHGTRSEAEGARRVAFADRVEAVQECQGCKGNGSLEAASGAWRCSCWQY